MTINKLEALNLIVTVSRDIYRTQHDWIRFAESVRANNPNAPYDPSAPSGHAKTYIDNLTKVLERLNVELDQS